MVTAATATPARADATGVALRINTAARYTPIGLLVMGIAPARIECRCRRWSGSVVAVIGLELAGIPVKNMAPRATDAWMGQTSFASGWWCARAAWCSAC